MNDDDIFEITRKDRQKLFRLQSLIGSVRKMPPWENERKELLTDFLSKMDSLVGDIVKALKESSDSQEKVIPSTSGKLIRKPDISAPQSEIRDFQQAELLKKQSFEDGRKFAEREIAQKMEAVRSEAFAAGLAQAQNGIERIRTLPVYEEDEQNAYTARLETVNENLRKHIEQMKEGEQIAYASAPVSIIHASGKDRENHRIAKQFERDRKAVLFTRPIRTVEFSEKEGDERLYRTVYEYCLRKL